MTVADIRLERTCSAFPEQYDAFAGEKHVGYLRLRYGGFSVSFPDVSGDCIYYTEPEGYGYFTAEEREHFLGIYILDYSGKGER